MSSDSICALLLALNLLCVLAYLAFHLRRRREERRLHIMRGVFMLFCPLVGAAFFGISLLVRNAFFKPDEERRTKAMDWNRHRFQSVEVPDVASQLNVVSVGDAMAVSGKSDLRRLLLNLVKDAPEGTLGTISQSLGSEDSEAAHYSASAIASSLAEFQSRTLELERAVKAAPRDTAGYRALIEYLLSYLENRVFKGQELRMYVDRTAGCLTVLLSLGVESASSSYFRRLVRLYVEAEDTAAAVRWAERAEDCFPDTMDSYDARLRACYAAGDGEGFRRAMGELKKSPVVIDRETLELIRALS